MLIPMSVVQVGAAAMPVLPSARGHLTLSPMSSQFGWGPGVIRAGWTAAAWPSANRAIFLPVRVPSPCVVDKFVVGEGGTAGNNFDIGLYDQAGTLIISTGSQSKGTNTEHIIDVADTSLDGGLYYLALAHNSTAQSWGTLDLTNLGYCKLLGLRQMESAFPLPASATFATVTSTLVPFISARLKINDGIDLQGFQPVYPPLNVVTPAHIESCGLDIASNVLGGLTGWVGGASTAAIANQIRYFPFALHEQATARKMLVIIGAGTTGNIDVGIYDRTLARVVNSGSTVLGSANTLQEIEIADTLLDPGLYFMAYQFSSASGSLFTISGASDYFSVIFAPYYEEAAGGFGLPATATPVDSTASSPTIGPAFGVLFDSLT